MKRLLIVEDYIETRKVLKDFFEGISMYQFRLVGSGEEALDAVHEFVPEVILTDFNLPGMNGIDLYHEINRIYPGIRFIFMSGNPNNLSKVKNQGIGRSISKPFGFLEIMGLVEEVFKNI